MEQLRRVVARGQTRKTRIVCISDTHCQTPKLPKGDVLIHAGDLTNQGSYTELKKTVEWLEKAEFETKIVVAGNHDITLDAPFYEEHGSQWRWPREQDLQECRRLLTESPSITYLEHEAANVYLSSPSGPHTFFKVFGSPYSPKDHSWAFQYEAEDATRLWNCIPLDADVVVTHTPPKGYCDAATKDNRTGCEALLHALYRVRPMLAVCGHIHEARGVERMRWNLRSPVDGSVVEDVEKWQDPGAGNNKQSLVNLTTARGRFLSKGSGLTRRAGLAPQGDGSIVPQNPLQAGILTSRSCPAHSEAEDKSKRATFTSQCGEAVFDGQGGHVSDAGRIGQGQAGDVEAAQRNQATVTINAAMLGPRVPGKGMQPFNKAIVVDVDLPVWSFEKTVLVLSDDVNK